MCVDRGRVTTARGSKAARESFSPTRGRIHSVAQLGFLAPWASNHNGRP
jgi:hypothetical protein